MSRRTAEASKAIRQAWMREQQLVQEGKGTRDWTPEQQQDICNSGKAHDADGRAFEGHHMQNAVSHPEYQGDPENIQFLTHDEHFAAHNFNWQNPTNGYYDYISGKTLDFGNQKYVPCNVMELSEPIHVSIEGGAQDNGEDSPMNVNNGGEGFIRDDIDVGSPVHTIEDGVPSSDIAPDVEATPLWARAAKALSDFSEEHPIITGIAKAVGAATATAFVGEVVSTFTGSSNETRSNSGVGASSPAHHDEEATSAPATSSDSPSASNYPSERQSPHEHQVSGYDRIQNGKLVHVNPYKRGNG
jgi:hypothetical protein